MLVIEKFDHCQPDTKYSPLGPRRTISTEHTYFLAQFEITTTHIVATRFS